VVTRKTRRIVTRLLGKPAVVRAVGEQPRTQLSVDRQVRLRHGLLGTLEAYVEVAAEVPRHPLARIDDRGKGEAQVCDAPRGRADAGGVGHEVSISPTRRRATPSDTMMTTTESRVAAATPSTSAPVTELLTVP